MVPIGPAQGGGGPGGAERQLGVSSFVLALAATPFVPDVAERKPGWLASMRPHLGVPRAARSLFTASVPSLIATWALSVLYLSLGPELALSLLHSDSRLAYSLSPLWHA